MSIQQVLEPGWHPDPFGRHDWRYWDGNWTNHVADAATAPADPRAEAAPPEVDELAPLREPIVDSTSFFAAPDLGAPPFDLGEATGFESSLAEQLHAHDTPEPEPDVVMDELPSKATRGAVAVAPQPREDDEDDAPVQSRWRRRKQLASQHAVPGVVLPPMHHPVSMPGSSPIDFGRAAIVMLSAFAIGVSAYLPWTISSVGEFRYEQTGMETGHGWYFVAGGVGMALFALVAARFRVLRLAPLGVAIAMFATASSELVRTVDNQNNLESSAIAMRIHLGAGMFALLGFSALGVLASLRLSSRR